jgi:hypothetical protein
LSSVLWVKIPKAEGEEDRARPEANEAFLMNFLLLVMCLNYLGAEINF